LLISNLFYERKSFLTHSLLALPGQVIGKIRICSHIFDRVPEEFRKHAKIIPAAITLMPDRFTITQLQALQEAVCPQNWIVNFHKNIFSVYLPEKLEE